MNRGSVLAVDFPLRVDDSEVELRAAREAFTWGPQATWLLAGLFWLFFFFVRDIRDLARNTVFLALGATVLGALGLFYEIRRRKRRVALYPLGARLGCYHQGAFQYSFAPEEMVRVRTDFFDRLFVVLKMVLPFLMIAIILVVIIVDGAMSHPLPFKPLEILLLLYPLGFTVFALVAVIRAHFVLRFFWIPNGKRKTDRPAHFSREDLRKLDIACGPSCTLAS